MRSLFQLSTVAGALLCSLGADAGGVTPATNWSSRTAAFIDAARDRTLQEARSRAIHLPPDFLAWVDGDPLVRTTVYGCRADPLPVLLQLRSLEIDLGSDTIRREYTQLALAFAIQDSYTKRGPQGTPWNDADDAQAPDTLPDVSPRAPLMLAIPGDPRIRVDTKDPSRPLGRDDQIVNFLEDHPEIEEEIEFEDLAPLEYDERGHAQPRRAAARVRKTIRRPLRAADVIASRQLQQEFNAFMAMHGHPDVTIDCGDRAVSWRSTNAIDDDALRGRIAGAYRLFHDAYRATGRMPATRDRAPTAAESMAWFIRNDRWPFSDADRAARRWPRFPLRAPWPVLMMLVADDQPLREREDVWLRFRDHGEFHTYGEYIGGIAQQFDMQSARRLAPLAFSYGSIQMMWKDGGVCGTMGNIGARTHRIVGQPASTASQPGHCALVFMEYDPHTREYACKGGQYATGGDDVTGVHAGWNYDDKGGRRPMVFHQSVAWGVNAGLPSFVASLAMVRAYDSLSAEDRGRECVGFVKAAVSENAFALAAITAALENAPHAEAARAIADACAETLATATDERKHTLYRATVSGLALERIRQLAASAAPEQGEQPLAQNPDAPPVAHRATAPRIVGYLQDHGTLRDWADRVAWSQLTHLCIAFVNPRDDSGTLSVPAGTDAVIAAGHRAGVKLLASLGGGGASEDAAMRARYARLLADDRRPMFVREVVAYLGRHGFDGLDVDLEGAAIDDRYGPFIRDLSAAVRTRGLLLTAALSHTHGGDRVPQEALAALDFVNVMAYDLTGPWRPEKPGPHAPSEFAHVCVAAWLGRGLPREKIVLGVPFYGHGFGADFSPHGIGFREIVLRHPGAATADRAGDVIWFNGARTIRDKADFAVREGLGGIMIWSIDHDAEGDAALLPVIHAALRSTAR